jgi:hypothetical protein
MGKSICFIQYSKVTFVSSGLLARSKRWRKKLKPISGLKVGHIFVAPLYFETAFCQLAFFMRSGK